MKILVTGARGFVGRNLCATLCNLRDGKDKTRPDLLIEEIMTYDKDTDPARLDEYCRRADFVFHLAGVNRARDPETWMQGNMDLTAAVLEKLRQKGSQTPLLLTSSIQATCIGRYDTAYGHSKKAAEEAVFAYAKESGADVFVYRLPNLFGKWCRPYAHSVVATFCHNIARDLPITVDDPRTELELLYIDDLIAEFLSVLEGKVTACTGERLYCPVPATDRVTLGNMRDLLLDFRKVPKTLTMPAVPPDSFEGKLHSTYVSYLPETMWLFDLPTAKDARGSFTECLKSAGAGQFSVNISAPGATKGNHWHHSKWELFVVVSGQGRVRLRALDAHDTVSLDVSGRHLQAVQIPPGYVHCLENLSETEELITLIWANESFDPHHPDTYGEPIA